MELSSDILSQIIIYSKYARYLEKEKRREVWGEIIERNKSMHIKKFPFLKEEIEKNYSYVLEKKVLPSMRSLQFAGRAIEISPQRMFNCSAIAISDWRSFSEIMALLLQGCGVGISVQRHHIDQLPPIRKPLKRKKRYLIPDSVEGWAESIKVLMKSYFFGTSEVEFDFGDIRERGALLSNSGGRAPGPQPLKDCIHNLKKVLDEVEDGEKLTPFQAHEIVCYISDAVLSGGIRRSACLSLFSLDDEEMLFCKNGDWWDKKPHLSRANNTAMLIRHKVSKEVFDNLWNIIKDNKTGEPGFDFSNDSEYLLNPCSEAALKISANGSGQFCNLTEVNVSNIENQEDLEERVRVASFIGTLQSAYTNFHYLRESWRKNTEKDSLLGIGLDGLANKDLYKWNLKKCVDIAIKENERVSKILRTNKAARLTVVKPSGCRPWYSLVTTDKGIKTLEELFENHNIGEKWSNFLNNEYVLQDGGKRQKILKTYDNGKDIVYKIHVEGQIIIESTKNHLWFVNERYDRTCRKRRKIVNDFVETEKLVKGDVLEVALGLYDNKEHKELKTIKQFFYNMRGNQFVIKQPKFMNEDLAWLIGYLWGDGCLSPLKYRLRFTDEYLNHLEKAQKIVYEQFGLNSKIVKCQNKNAYVLEIASKQLFDWFLHNGIRKYYNDEIDLVPLCIRSSTKEDIISFICGFLDADGCVYKSKQSDYFKVLISQKPSLFTRHLQDVALTVGLHFNHSYNLEGANFQKKKNIVLMNLSSFSLKQSVDIMRKYSEKIKKKVGNSKIICDELNYKRRILGKVIFIEEVGEMETYDVEIENEPWFYAGAFKSHNTSSLVLGCSSGIHSWYGKYYIRRIRLNKEEPIYKYLKSKLPNLLEDDKEKPYLGAVLSIPIKAPEGAILRKDETSIEFLERVKYVYENWIKPGHRVGSNTHSVSCTVNIKDNEWDNVGEWLWKNKDYYNCVSVIPYDNSTYTQMPYEECSKEKYEELMKFLVQIDLSEIVEEENNVELQGEMACSGGSCEISHLFNK